MSLLITVLVNTIAVLIASKILPGVAVESFSTAVLVAIVFGVLNAVVKPVLVLITLPITLLTLGLFTFIINALLVLLVAAIIPGFHVSGFFAALLFSLVVSLVGAVLHQITS